MSRARARQHGFTLLEMLIALVVFAMLSLGGYQMLRGLTNTALVSRRHSDQLAALERTFALMGADFHQATMLSLRGMKLQGVAGGPGWLGSDQGGISLIRLGWKNVQAKEQRSGVLRVGYIVEDGVLIRQFYRHLNPVSGQLPQQQRLLTDVSQLQFRFFEKGGGWLTRWHRNDQLPQAIEVTFSIKGVGKLRRSFLLTPDYQAVEKMMQAQEDETSTLE
ncbi:type II secretion system minor pseudopilin GspJ [Celerinatantimonas sp. YJH-8]|uniref:type II secretion system minor pseudopilin GspJ n=1 Tax=Celerinatantimonas sp. YJH-8 TaxID=3228714 RepID=UPI0038C052E0